MQYFSLCCDCCNGAYTGSRRDSGLDETDSFRIIIDGLLNRQNGYVFGTNPAGIEYDAQVIKEGLTGV